MYLSFGLILMGAWLALGSMSPLVVLIAYIFFTERRYIFPEEKRLGQIFGRQYEAYRLRTRRWL